MSANPLPNQAGPRRVAILGATGSIGSSALDVIARHPGQMRASVLAAGNNVDALIALCRSHRPEHAADVQAAVVVLQRPQQGFGALRPGGVVAQCAHQQRQRGADRACGLLAVQPQLLGDLLQRCALQLGKKIVGEAHRAGPGGECARPW